MSIVSPLYPDNYPNNIELVWIIQTEMNWTILISFSNFSTEGGYDYFRAGNGADYTENMFFEWSGNSLPNDQLSTGNIMWLRFTSDSSVTARGFALTAISVAPPGKNHLLPLLVMPLPLTLSWHVLRWP